MSGRPGTEGEEVTIVPVTATAAASTPSPSAAARGVEASQITWSVAPPHWPQHTAVGSRRTWLVNGVGSFNSFSPVSVIQAF